MPRLKSPRPQEGHFGHRLAAFRADAGLTQRALAKVSGVSQRMVAYYEVRPALPPGHVLSQLAEALGLSVDELVGKAQPSRRQKSSRRLLRRLQQLESLPLKEKRALLSVIDTFLERHHLARERAA